MAVFGAPVAHEDHARRACYAALQMLDDVSEYAAELRRGHGPQLLDPDRDQLRRGRRRGDRRRRRRRLHRDRPHGRAGAADGGAGRARQGLPDRAHGRARRRLPRPRRPRRVRDQGREPSRSGSSSWPGSARPLAARPLPRARLLPLRRPRRRDGGAGSGARPGGGRAKGGAVGLVAEPGVGKSRLCHEFAERCRERRGRGLRGAGARRTGRSIPFMPVLQMLRSFFGIGEREPEQLAREKIAGRALLLDPGFADDLPLMFDFLGVPDPDRPVPQMSAEARQRALGGIVCRLVNAPSRRKTLVLVIEDLHWIDEGSNAMLAGLVELDRGHEHAGRASTSGPSTRPPGAARRAYRGIALEPLARRTPASCCATWPARTPRSTGSTSRSTSAPRATRSSSRRSSASWPSPATSRASAAPTGWCGRSRTPACRSPCRRSSPPASTASTPDAKQLLQVASVVGKEVSGRALGLTAGLERRGDRPGALRADRGRLPLRSRALPAAGARLPPPADPRGRLRHPAGRTAGGDPRGGGAGDDRARARPPRRAGGAGRPPHGGGRRDPGSGALVRPRRPLGRPQPAARRDAPVAAGDGAGRRARARARRRRRCRCLSRMLQLEYAWRLGMDREQADGAGDRGDRDRRPGRRPALAGAAEAADLGPPGVAEHADEWIAGGRRGDRASPTNRATRPAGRRSAAPAPTPHVRRRPRRARADRSTRCSS